MSSACSAASWQRPYRGLEMSAEDTKLQEAERTLEHQLSTGNAQLRSIDAEWLEQHKDLLDIFIQNPNDPAVLEQIPQTTTAMDVCQADSSSQQQQQQHLGTLRMSATSHATSEPSLELRTLLSLGHPRRSQQGNIVTTGFGDSSPAVETPQQQAKQPPALRILQSARSDPTGTPVATPTRSSACRERNLAGLQPEVSLAARAGSMGATSMQSSQRNLAGRRQSASEAVRTSDDSDELGTLADEPALPARKGPGRKKRTAPILVETETGETKYVSPAEYRKLRRRITNRMSARRMRKKHAEERAVVQDTTRTLEDERNYFKSTCEHMSRQLGQLELRCRQLFEENQVLKQSRWGSVHSEGPTAAEVSQQAMPRTSMPSFQLGQFPSHASSSMMPLPRPASVQSGLVDSFAFGDITASGAPVALGSDFGRSQGAEALNIGGLLGMPHIPPSTPFPLATSSELTGLSSLVLPGRPL